MMLRLFSGLLIALCMRVFSGAVDGQSTDPTYQRGAALYRSADCASAISDLATATAKAPQAGLPLARCYFEAQQYGKATEAITAFRKAAPRDPQGAILMAQIQERDGHADTAAAQLETYLQQNPDQLAAHNALGDLYARLGQGPQAMNHYHLVTAAQTDDPAARIGLGELAVREKRYQEAIDEFEKARAIVPKNFRMLAGLGTAYVQLGNCAQAVGPLRQAQQLAPDDFPLAKSLAACYASMKLWPDLLTSLRTGTPEEAADPEATAMVMKAFENTKDIAAAEAYLRRVLAAAPANIAAHTDLGDLLYDGNRRPEARIQYLEVVKLAPDSPRIHERLGDMSQETPENSAETRAHYEAAAHSKGAVDSARMKLARLCFSAEDMACTNAALADIKSPGLKRDVTLLRLQVEFRAQNWDGAGALANELLAVDRSNLTVLRIAGEVADRQNRPLDATVLLEQALALDPSSKDLRYRLAGIYSNNTELHRAQRAVEILTEYVNKYQQDAEGFLLLANAYRKLDDSTNAKLNFKQGFARVTPPVPARLSWAYNSYGYMMLSEMNYDEAYTYLTQAVNLNTVDESSLFNFALTCLQLGRTEELNLTRSKLQAVNSPFLSQLDQEIERKGRTAGKRKGQ